MTKFSIQIWFDSPQSKTLLSTVAVYAETEERAIELAKTNTEYLVSGVNDMRWQVREQAVSYT